MTENLEYAPPRGMWLKAVALGLALMACGMVLGGVAVYFYMVSFADPGPPLPPSPDMVARRIERQLGLDAKQAEAVYEILLRNHPAFEALHEKVAPEAEALINKVQAEVAEVLNPKQREKWQHLYEEQQRKWKEMHSKGANASPASAPPPGH